MLWPLYLLLLGLHGALAHPPPPTYPESDFRATIRPLAQFPNNTWVENLAVRSNGKLLITVFTSPHLYQLDPFKRHPSLDVVATLPECLGTLGIAEIEPDVFAISKGNVSFATQEITPKSFAVWKVAFAKGGDKPALSKIANMPEATFLNGVAAHKDSLFVADSLGGVIWRVNLANSTYRVLLNQSETQPVGTFLEGGFGANGVSVRDGALYFTNTNKGFFRVPVSRAGAIRGPVETLTSFTRADDFAFDGRGDVYIARGADDRIEKFARGTLEEVPFTNRDAARLIEGNTAVKFGRTARDRSTLYVVTNGGQTGLVNGTQVEGGRILAIDLGRHR